jgi:ribonuclease VapC
LSTVGVVLDASAALAPLLGERGGEKAFGQLRGAAISAVSWAEVVQRAISAGVAADSLRADFEGMGVEVIPVDAEHAERAARLPRLTRSAGLSLADRTCIALALDRRVAVLTADRAWADLDVGVEVRLLR